jgi:hypothetical protein
MPLITPMAYGRQAVHGRSDLRDRKSLTSLTSLTGGSRHNSKTPEIRNLAEVRTRPGAIFGLHRIARARFIRKDMSCHVRRTPGEASGGGSPDHSGAFPVVREWIYRHTAAPMRRLENRLDGFCGGPRTDFVYRYSTDDRCDGTAPAPGKWFLIRYRTEVRSLVGHATSPSCAWPSSLRMRRSSAAVAAEGGNAAPCREARGCLSPLWEPRSRFLSEAPGNEPTSS